jgi:UDP-2,3-diacylglucosamine pyrophosphatase LpxH
MHTKRKVEVVVISDVHLGTYGCHAKELLQYLKSIQPKKLILNGDIIDIWNFSKRYFPTAHLKVINRILKMASQGVEVIYITGNHDDFLRQYTDIKMGKLRIVNHYSLVLNAERIWLFHGDVFDATTNGTAKILARLGGKGYDWLILFNRFVNRMLQSLGRPRVSLSKKIKDGVKRAVSWIADFENKAADMAIQAGYDVVICGHIHKPQDRIITTDTGRIRYLNSGDWVENLSALEYNQGQWSFYHADDTNQLQQAADEEDTELASIDLTQLFSLQTQLS